MLSQASAVDVRQRLDFDLQVRTREGDLVTISFDQKVDVQGSTLGSVSAGAAGLGLDLDSRFSSSAQTRLAVSVSGDLNDTERIAIDGLLKQIQATVDEFVGGATPDLRQVLDQYGQMPEALSEFALSLNVQQSYRARAAYTQNPVQALAQPGLARFGATQAVLDQLAQLGDAQKDLMATARDRFEDVSAAGLVRAAVPEYLGDVLRL